MKILINTLLLFITSIIMFSCSESEEIANSLENTLSNPLENTVWYENRYFSENCSDESNEFEYSYACTDSYCMEIRFTKDSMFIEELRTGDLLEKHPYSYENGVLQFSQATKKVVFRGGNMLWDRTRPDEDCNIYFEFVPAN
ncbi:hypothetical protein [Marinigracilibium pacificum]|uniref:Uncharacterized protein n=1 Tax=Marinigracilibium pacificum TaxID=2729599 RepID=A0A848IYI0_9BACT|nr:hypothetical protein [Marinigracilibium pacificum]NMM48335.1 hypothetical protein [Marinigracilibium pacificum]